MSVIWERTRFLWERIRFFVGAHPFYVGRHPFFVEAHLFFVGAHPFFVGAVSDRDACTGKVFAVGDRSYRGAHQLSRSETAPTGGTSFRGRRPLLQGGRTSFRGRRPLLQRERTRFFVGAHPFFVGAHLWFAFQWVAPRLCAYKASSTSFLVPVFSRMRAR